MARRIARLRSAEAGVAASRVAGVPGVRDGAARLPAALRGAAGRRGARWARHRHRHRARGGREDLDHGRAPAVRAHRRWRELAARGADVVEATVLDELLARDAQRRAQHGPRARLALAGYERSRYRRGVPRGASHRRKPRIEGVRVSRAPFSASGRMLSGEPPDGRPRHGTFIAPEIVGTLCRTRP